MVSKHIVICGWCMTGQHEQCLQKHKHYDVWYECPCSTGICATRNSDAEQASGDAGTQTETSDTGTGTEPQESGEEASGNGSGLEDPGTEPPVVTKPSPSRGRPRKGANK